MRRTLRTSLLLGFLLVAGAPGALPQQEAGFSNPILGGFHPDPSICRVGSDYYLVTSTFSYFPGIPVFHSRDLVNWDLLGHVMNREEQLNLDGQGVSRGLFAPTIRYHDGLFYVVCTLVDIGGNFVATASSPAGPWSGPIWIPEINGIDPSLFFDDDGKAYVVYNSIPPDDTPLYGGHRTIRMYSFDPRTLKVVGKEHLLVNGGVDITKKPVWIEAPHIFKKDGEYYLIAAEGGTGDQHSEVVFRSKSVEGPYVPREKNPLLTQRHLDPGREAAITSTGHADFVKTESGDWWAVFLGCRPYPPSKDGCYNTGRETFLAPVRWDNGWPIITSGDEKVQYRYPYPLTPHNQPAIPFGGDFKIKEDFDENTLRPSWVFLRTPHEKWYDLDVKKGFLTLKLRPETCAGRMNPSFVGRRQQHMNGSASTAVTFIPRSEREKAGLLVFQNETHFYFLCKTMGRRQAEVRLYRSVADTNVSAPMDLLASKRLGRDEARKEVRLKVEAHGASYVFLFGFDGGPWQTLKDGVDARFLSTKVAGGFVGCMYAMYATSSGKPSKSSASFGWFEYAGDDHPGI
jgi:xylan 1,4-beta-xylosidase